MNTCPACGHSFSLTRFQRAFRYLRFPVIVIAATVLTTGTTTYYPYTVRCSDCGERVQV